MPSSRSVRSIIIALLVLLGGSAGVDAAVGSTIDSSAARRSEVGDEQLFVSKINELRTGLGLEPLTVSPTLVPLARDWAAQLRAKGALAHAEDLSVGVTEDWSRLGENVGVGPADQVQALFDAFVASPAHYANLVKPDYRYLGVGVVYGEDGRIWTTHRFMALASGASGPPTSAPTSTPTPSTAPSSTPTTAPPRDIAGAAPNAATPGSTPNGAAASTPTTEPQQDAASTTTSTTTPPPPRLIVAPALVEQLTDDLAAAGL